MTHTWTTNPATGQPWTFADVNALEAGIESDAATMQIRATQLFVSVDLGVRSDYAYDDGPSGINNLTAISGAETVAFTYTVNGDLATKTEGGVTWTYAYNVMALLREVNEGSNVRETHFYDGFGRRVKAVEGSTTTFFVYCLGLDPALGEDRDDGDPPRVRERDADREDHPVRRGPLLPRGPPRLDAEGQGPP